MEVTTFHSHTELPNYRLVDPDTQPFAKLAGLKNKKN
jgi:hypothetical protein